jgi:hypothetical protein
VRTDTIVAAIVLSCDIMYVSTPFYQNTIKTMIYVGPGSL